ncbi:hypothetical protein ACP70R_000756 [Stipagrostis hirtigluma subsp. patula]
MRKAGAKEDFEGSIGSKGVVGVNQSPVLAGRQSDFMIQFCMCTRRISSSSLCNLNDTDILMTCKGCSGESTSDRGGPSCSSKLNGMGLELPRPIDPEVRWKTVKRRQRAARRARTSFSGEDRMKDQIGSFYAFGNVASKGVGHKDAPVSESEKLGVSILGRRFSDPMENVPIKKRRFQMDCSPSPPSTPLLVDPHEKLLSSSSGGISSYERRRKAKILGGESKEEKKGAFDADDFSGISILAAAACESGMDGDVLDGACSKLAHPLEETKSESTIGSTELSLLHGMEEDKLKIQEASHCIYDGPNRPLESSKSASDMKPLFATTLSSSENLVESASVPKVNCSLYSALSSVNKTDVSECSNVAIRDSSSNPDKSVGNSQVTAVQTKRDSTRLHWDLNVEMEAWDTECGGDDDHIAAAISNHDDAGNDMNKPQTSHDLFGSTDAGNLPDVTSDKIHIVDEPKDDKTKDKDDTPADSSPHALRPQSPQTLQLLESESTGNDTSAEKMVLPDQHKSTFAPIMESHLGSNPEPVPVAEHFPLMANVEKIDGSHPSSVDGEGLSHAGGNSIQTSDLGSTVKPLASRIVSEESTNHQPVASFNKKGTNFVWSDNKLEEASRHSISEFKNQELLDVDSGTSKIEQSVNNKAEHDTDVLHAIESTADPESLTQPEGDPGSSGCDMAHVHEEDGADAMINSKESLVPCANSSSAETYYISSAVPQAPGPNSECTTQGVTDACSIVDSHSAAQSYQNGYKDELRKVASDSCLEHCSETDASHISRHLTGIGEVDVEEEDSQYEDGELRESGDGYWADDGYEEVKRANWHYNVSDYKNEAGTPGLPSHPIDSIPKNMDITAAGYNRIQARKEGGAVTPVSSKRSWSTNCLDDGSGTIYAASTGGKARSIHLRVTCDSQMYDVHPGRVAAGTAETVSQSQRCSDGLGDNMLSTGMKSTGWDMPPEDQRHSRHYSREGADSSTRCVLSSLDAAEGDELLRKTGPSKTDVQRVERPRSFERSHRYELSRSDDGYSTGSKAERTNDSNRSYGIYDAKRHIQAGSRGEQWVKNSKHPRSTHRRSPDYYNYGPSGPRNAAEAAVAKMESNGFVVAPDGTLVRAADPANAGHMARRMRNTLNSSYRPLAGRGSPVDRDTACGLSRGAAHAREASSEHFGASSNRSGRYGPDMQKDNTTDGSLSSVHCSLSSKQRGIRTGRASINLSRAHSRSPSGSRSRSPHDWTSPRNRRKIMANGGSTLRRHSRSPPNMTKARMGRMNSPQRQHGFDDRATRYSPPSRNNTYPQHASTWADGRNCSTEDPSDRNRRFSRRSPLRNTSRNDRFDVMDSEGRSRSGEFYRPAQGWLPYGYERGNKDEGSGDHPREYAGRYGSHSVKPYDRNGAVKQFRNNTGDKFRTRISSPRSPELQRRGSPRRFDRGFEK